MKFKNNKSLFFRSLVLLIIVTIFFIFLILNLYYIQVIHFHDYYFDSNQNFIRIKSIIPKRGIIYDRNSIPISLNQQFYKIQLIPNYIRNLKKIINQLHLLLDLNSKDIESLKYFFDKKIFESVILSKHINNFQISYLLMNQYRFLGIKLKKYYVRNYPYKNYVNHIIGYTNNAQKKINLLKKFSKNNDVLFDHSGKIGIEKYYENILYGKIGYLKVKINKLNHILKKLCINFPKYGKDIFLSVDLKLQILIKNLVSQNRAGIIITDPRNGEILSMVSNPSYNPNIFINKISRKNYNSLLKDKNYPLINRVTQGKYSPGSIIKPYIGIASLNTGTILNNTILMDPGWWKLPESNKLYHDWKKNGHNFLNITNSIEESSDTFFYQIAYDMGIDCLMVWMKKFGYNFFINTSFKEKNNVPNKKWKIIKNKKNWYHGDIIPIGIGQGYWNVTPLEINNSIMILINNGTIKVPHLLFSIYSKNRIFSLKIKKNLKNILNVKFDHWEIIKNAMYNVVHHNYGTANKFFKNSSYKVAAKSGTVQVYSLKKFFLYKEKNILERLKDHKMMIAFSPYKNSKIAITIVLENTEDSIGLIMRKILDHLMIFSFKKIF